MATKPGSYEAELIHALQQTLIPPSPPRVPGLDVAAVYQPAVGEVGGDFYDVFEVAEGDGGSRAVRQVDDPSFQMNTTREAARPDRPHEAALAAGQRPQLRRVVAFRPASGVIEMTVVVSFGSRVRALAVRLEHTPPPRALPGHQPRRPRWLCTDVEAA